MKKSSANPVKTKLARTTREKIAKCICCGAERDEVKNGKPRFNSDHSFIVHRSCKKKHASQFDPIHEHSVAAVNSAVADGETFVHSDSHSRNNITVRKDKNRLRLWRSNTCQCNTMQKLAVSWRGNRR